MYNIEEFDEQKTKVLKYILFKKEQNKKLEISFLRLYQKNY